MCGALTRANAVVCDECWKAVPVEEQIVVQLLRRAWRLATDPGARPAAFHRYLAARHLAIASALDTLHQRHRHRANPVSTTFQAP
ncbi:MAG: hypothetical protein NXI03_04585 [Alphaproteobacteria bacterium]|nr:hypothetical protein [Alphaproteobacteria bacterium]